MSLNIPRTAIAFQGGAYGNYIKWILYSLIVPGELASPFSQSTSHNRNYIDPAYIHNGIMPLDHATLEDLRTQSTLKLSTIHPVNKTNQTFKQAINNIASLVDRVILPYCDHSTYLLGVNNFLFKIWNNVWVGPLAYINKQDLIDGWNVDVNDLDNVPRWILREHHSMNVFDMWEAQNGWYAPAYIKKDNCHFVLLHDLFYNFMDTVESLRKFLAVDWIRDPEELLPYHRVNIQNQTYKNQDTIAKSILDSVCDNTDYSWNATDITLYTEAYIQRRLQQLGYVLECNELNEFPTSTNELLEACA